MTTNYDLIFDEISVAITNAESMYQELTHKDANYLRGMVSDYLDYIADRAVANDETTTPPISERNV